MAKLGDVLQSLYEAPREVETLRVSGVHTVDHQLLQRAHRWWFEERQRAQGGTGSSMVLLSTAGEDQPVVEQTDNELIWAGPDHWRHDSDDLVTVRVGDELLTYRPAIGGIRSEGGAMPPWFGLLTGRWMLARFTFENIAGVEIAGRPCWRVQLRAAPDEAPGPGFGLSPFGWIGTAGVASIDQATGVILAMESQFDGAVVSSLRTTSFEVDPSIDPAVLEFDPPDGKGFRSPLEAQLEALRASGVDVSDIDVNNPTEVMQAVARHHGMTSITSMTPADRSEQYVATGPPPADPETAEAEVRAAFAEMVTTSEDGEAVPAVQGGSNLGPCLREAGARAPGGGEGGPATVAVEHVKFLDRDDALVWFTLRLGSGFDLGPQPGRAVREGDRWLVSRATFCELLVPTGVRCPPPPEA